MSKLQMIDEIAQAVVYGAIALAGIGGIFALMIGTFSIAAKGAGL